MAVVAAFTFGSPAIVCASPPSNWSLLWTKL